MSFDALLTDTIDVLEATTTADAAGGQSRLFDIKYSGLKCRHEQSLLPSGPPEEIGGSPTLINVHRFFLRDPGSILTADVIVDEEGTMLRPASTPNLRRRIGTLSSFITITCHEVQGAAEPLTSVLMDQNGNFVRDQNSELILTP